jgi:hypothetical protein
MSLTKLAGKIKLFPAGRVWLVASRQVMGKSLTFFTVILVETGNKKLPFLKKFFECISCSGQVVKQLTLHLRSPFTIHSQYVGLIPSWFDGGFI